MAVATLLSLLAGYSQLWGALVVTLGPDLAGDVMSASRHPS